MTEKESSLFAPSSRTVRVEAQDKVPMAWVVWASGEGSTDYRLCTTAWAVRQAYIDFVVGDCDPAHKNEVDEFMASFEGDDEWAPDVLRIELYCAVVEVHRFPAAIFVASETGDRNAVLDILRRAVAWHSPGQIDHPLGINKHWLDDARRALKTSAATAAQDAAPQVENSGPSIGEKSGMAPAGAAPSSIATQGWDAARIAWVKRLAADGHPMPSKLELLAFREGFQAAPSAIGPNYEQLEALIVEVVRRVGVKAGVPPEVYGAMNHGIREIINLASTDGGRNG